MLDLRGCKRLLTPSLAVLTTACGAKAVVDPLGDAGVTTTSTTSSPTSSTTSTTTTTTGPDVCALCEYAEPLDLGPPANTAITEASGLAASDQHQDVYYLHNDSGDVSRFFAIDGHGTDRGEYVVQGASAVDWEDMEVSPCPKTGSCLYLGDIGDNSHSRDVYSVYLVPEPLDLAPGVHTVTGTELRFVYPDGSHDAETLIMDGTGVLHVVTKVSDGPSGLYSFPVPLVEDYEMLLTKQGSITPMAGAPQLTAGTASFRGVLLRTYEHLFFYPSPPGHLPGVLANAPCRVAVGFELQGEAVAWMRETIGYLTTGEGAGSSLFRVSCEQ